MDGAWQLTGLLRGVWVLKLFEGCRLLVVGGGAVGAPGGGGGREVGCWGPPRPGFGPIGLEGNVLTGEGPGEIDGEEF